MNPMQNKKRKEVSSKFSDCCELEELTMSNYAPEVHNKRRRKKKKKKTKRNKVSPPWSLLPDDIVILCMARVVSRLDHASLSLVSKNYRSLIASPGIGLMRSLKGCTEESLYVCLRISPDPNPCWFVLTRNHRLSPVQSYPYQAPELSSFVVVDWGIYVIGGIVNGNPISDVLFLDCFTHTWRRVPCMKTPRASASAHLVDGKIYVLGGCEEDADDDDDDDDSASNWAEVFDLKTQTWDVFQMPEKIKHINKSVVIEEKKVYAVDEENQSFCYLPSEGTIWRSGIKDCKRGYRSDWCVIGELLYCLGTRGRILWCEPDKFRWKEVKGLENLRKSLSGSTKTFEVSISRLTCNSAGNIVIFWKVTLGSLELWSAEISLERRGEGEGEIWGNIMWSGPVFKVDPLSNSFSVEVPC